MFLFVVTLKPVASLIHTLHGFHSVWRPVIRLYGTIPIAIRICIQIRYVLAIPAMFAGVLQGVCFRLDCRNIK
jgi:hypothetical protein